MTTSSSNIKGLPDSNNKNPLWKEPIRVANATVVIIDESIVQKLQIDEQHTFLEKIPTSEGILKISSKKIESSHVWPKDVE
jgi:hypothetical protein